MTNSWRSTLETSLSTHRDDPTARYFQLATIGVDGRPANRTVVFRGFRPESDDLLITADARSRKVAEIHRDPFVEACWYFGRTREQFRLAGILQRLDETDRASAALREAVWRDLSGPVHVQFTWPTPGSVWQDDESHGPAPIDGSKPPAAFVVLILVVERVDYLRLQGDPPLRRLHESGPNGWSVRRINP